MTTHAFPTTFSAVPNSAAATPSDAGDNEALQLLLDCYDELVGRDVAFVLAEDALDLLLGRVEDMPSHEALFIARPTLASATISVLLSQLTDIVASHGDSDCTAMRAPAVIRTLGAVLCDGCLPRADIRAALRHTVRPTDFVTGRMYSEPAHWLPLLALTLAACLCHNSDPDSALAARNALS